MILPIYIYRLYIGIRAVDGFALAVLFNCTNFYIISLAFGHLFLKGSAGGSAQLLVAAVFLGSVIHLVTFRFSHSVPLNAQRAVLGADFYAQHLAELGLCLALFTGFASKDW